ncbi:putative regulator of nonsense transcripts 2-like [Capsicum annuum]|nr:putative regulator of nonsense transcripts 2-like [Capsicum annuum]
MTTAVWTTMTEIILQYTGLWPTTFFTTVALMSLHLGDMPEEELRAYNGSDSEKPLLMAIKEKIYDVSTSKMFYSPGGSYAMLAGRDASRALAQLSFKLEDFNGSLEGLSDAQLKILQDWEYKFMDKFARVGQLVLKKTPTENKTEEESFGIRQVLKASKADMLQEIKIVEQHGLQKDSHP